MKNMKKETDGRSHPFLFTLLLTTPIFSTYNGSLVGELF
ncbi:hypothetical protein X953_07935 [Virgibacillus sp. SK37]|nr:hypothetical protein X953_07935 [Virgibacillus sp. SK37]